MKKYTKKQYEAIKIKSAKGWAVIPIDDDGKYELSLCDLLNSREDARIYKRENCLSEDKPIIIPVLIIPITPRRKTKK